jgi:5,10-methylene-tetrahydrofolate dehydrogenase/methenyl tetrahydrofolate cyclohydrolase
MENAAPNLDELAGRFRREVQMEVQTLGQKLKLVGLLANNEAPSVAYANYTNEGCNDVGIHFDLRRIEPRQIAENIERANSDASVHGIIVYYPVQGTDVDNENRQSVLPSKDIEGLHSYWSGLLYANQRFIDAEETKKAILPCTAVAIVKILEFVGVFDTTVDPPLLDKVIAIFNRSPLVGGPLAAMLSHEGATIYSVDLEGTLLTRRGQFQRSSATRADVLKRADVVISGVPAGSPFRPRDGDELRPEAVCICFSSVSNYAKSVQMTHKFIRRIGQVTVAMVLRNTLRLFKHFHAKP